MTIYGVQSITYDPKTPAGQAPAPAANPQQQELDFLNLLVSQISNQTPDNPMDPTAMITQYSQMEASIDLIKLQASTSAYQNSALAGSLLGKQVQVKVKSNGSEGETVSGTISGIDFSTDKPRINLNGAMYPLADVIHVGN
jgi:flagellar basal-body rod modification protein FlgD